MESGQKNQLRVFMEELPVCTWAGKNVHKLPSIWQRWPFTTAVLSPTSLSPSWICSRKSRFSVPLESSQILKWEWEKLSSLCSYKVNVDFSETCLLRWRVYGDSLVCWGRLVKASGNEGAASSGCWHVFFRLAAELGVNCCLVWATVWSGILDDWSDVHVSMGDRRKLGRMNPLLGLSLLLLRSTEHCRRPNCYPN